MDADCPCGNGTYADCCGRYHAGAQAPTAEALMRSRYVAYARSEIAYLMRTSHPSLRRRTSVKDLQGSCSLEWCGLEILAVRAGGQDDATGDVKFRAHYRQNGLAKTLEECSRFSREAGHWVYRDAGGTV